jgi:hypothetical protein
MAKEEQDWESALRIDASLKYIHAAVGAAFRCNSCYTVQGLLFSTLREDWSGQLSPNYRAKSDICFGENCYNLIRVASIGLKQYTPHNPTLNQKERRDDIQKSWSFDSAIDGSIDGFSRLRKSTH